MAMQSGVLFFDGRPTESECRTLTAALHPCATDGVTVTARPGIAMAFGAHHFWTGEDHCVQPLETSTGLLMTWDGRLDNRDDLLLRLSGQLDPDTADASIALAVFERWDVAGLRLLLGDWSLVIWNSRTRTLHLARDYMGARPLYYHANAHSVMWSTNLGELAIRANRVNDFDEMFVARFMTLQLSTDVTPYIGIRAVPTATTVAFSATGVERRHQFWRLEPGRICYRDHGQYEEHLRTLWVDAVGSRLRTRRAVWAELSGGLDSSSVVCMADALIKSGRVPAAGLHPVSHVTLESPEGDERRFIVEVEAKTGRATALFGLEAHDGERGEWDWETPLASRDVDVAIIRHVRQCNGRVMVTGRVGDIVMGCFPDHSVAVLDDLFDGRLPTALRNARLWSRASRKPLLEIAANLAKATARAHRGPVLQPNAQQALGSGLLEPRLQRMVTEQSIQHFDATGVRPSTMAMAALLLRYSSGALSSAPTPPSDIIYTHPFVHRPLVDFVFAIPAEQISAPGVTRSLMRRAFAGLVPSRILRRESKGYYPPALIRATRTLIATMPRVESLHVVRNGWLAAAPLAAAIQNLRDGAAEAGSAVRLALLLEQWLSTRDRRGPAATPQRKEVTTNAVLNA